MAITKLNSPLLVNGQPVYPKTSADQVTFKDCPPSSLQDMFNLIYPVGSIYMSINNVNPSTLFGGEWSQIKGRFLVGVGEIDDNTTDYWGALTGKYNMPAGEKGGQVKHKLTIDEMPYHNHDVSILANGWEGWGDDSFSDHEYSFTSWSNPKVFGGSTEHTSHVQTGVTSRYGGDGEHNNIPPYYAVYMWQRTA